MSLSYRFREALKIIDSLNEKERFRIRTLCLKIRAAEKALTTAGADLLKGCGKTCHGLCCRNIAPDSLIDTMDFVYLLSLERRLKDAVSRCLVYENPFYTADCIFLKDRVGPCLFPPDLRPQVCITAFCGGDHVVRKEIARVKRAFVRLGFFVGTRKARALLAKVFSMPLKG